MFRSVQDTRPIDVAVTDGVPALGRPALLDAVVGGVWVALVAAWASDRPWERRTVGGSAAWLGALSSLTAVSGLFLFATTIVLSARFGVVESLVGGLDKVYLRHHRYGSLAFALLLLHPALLTWERAQVWVARAARLWHPSGSVSALAGQVALALMIPAMVATLYLTVRHQRLVVLQRVLGLLVIPASIHALASDGRSTGGDASPLVRWLMWVAIAGAVLALVKHTVLGRRLDRHRPYVVASVEAVGPGLDAITLQPTAGQLHFVPGQFAFLRLRDDAVPTEPHPFSIASSPEGTALRFVVKELGDWTGKVGGISAGSSAVVEGPYGRFSHRFVRGRSQLWVAGGIGITPFLAMAASLQPTGCPYDVDLVWCLPSPTTTPPLIAELEALAAGREHLRVHVRSDADHVEDGPVTAPELRELCASSRGAPLVDREVLICGPEEMRVALRRQFLDLGIQARRLHEEGFRYR